MASYKQYTGTVCEHGHPAYYQVLEIRAWGHTEKRRRGPTCWCCRLSSSHAVEPAGRAASELMAKAHDVTRIPVEEVKTGYALVILSDDGLPPRQFNVEEVEWSFKQGEPAMLTLKSEPLADGKPWELSYPAGLRS